MQVLLQAAAIIRAVHFRRAPNNDNDLKNQLKQDILGLAGAESGSLVEMVKNFVEDLGNKYDSDAENSNPS